MELENYLNSYPFVRNHVLFYVNPKEITLKFLESNRALTVKKEAWEIFRLCNGENKLTDIINELSTEWDVNSQEVIQFIIDAKYKEIIDLQNNCLKKEIIIYGDDSNYYPTSISLILTEKCNLNCNYCYGNYNSKKHREIDVKSIPNLFKQFQKVGVRGIELSGGEPLMHSHFIEILKEALSTFERVNILSNGVLFNNEIFEIIKSNKNKIGIQISIDGSNEKINNIIRGCKNTFYRTINTIKTLVNIEALFRVSLAITNENKNDLLATCDLMKELGVKMFSYSLTDGIGRGSNQFYPDNHALNNQDSIYFNEMKELLKDIDKKFKDMIYGPSKFKEEASKIFLNCNNCGAGWQNTSILPNGDVIPCPLLSSEVVNLGNIFKEDFNKIYNGKSRNNFFREFFKEKEEPECQKCEYYNYCGNCLSKIYTANRDRLRKGKQLCSKVQETGMDKVYDFFAKFDFNI